ncbi:NAD-dependent epimerase/dehydratase family protein [Brevibacillus sp. SYP-B805]|uniref:NAD-dependent epimerase/dehydratase family protein n=1 Tax=Brevibacillus sp. SYP-B805 TaxID=1578199 RepID=UPI0013EC7788|nr:NAD-dependent epimerase/dehydratase family protein [Brevibacillus sp. SYP-B805]NGQ97309.1 NAD-dependent epimerase/dehydratase family protein [Brevibacillus sp. SYP-B805]
MTTALVTGCAGFIGSHLTQRLLQEGYTIIGIDGFTPNYDARLKWRNLSLIGQHPRFLFHAAPLQTGDWEQWLQETDIVFHQAALPGVRASWGNAFADYAANNLVATQQLLDACRRYPRIQKIVIASSSSVYGTMQEGLTDERAPLLPLSPYGVTKAAMEQLCRAYVNAYGLPIVLLRYFTVYGPRQRPDMAFHRFFRQLLRDEELQVYGDGHQTRDFTYVSDAVEANLLAARLGEAGDIYNIGGNREVSVLEAIEQMAALAGRKPRIAFLPEQAGDARRTCADIRHAGEKLGYDPQVSLEEGLRLQLDDMIEQERG